MKGLKKEDFMLTDYDDMAVRQLLERVMVEDKDTVTVRFKGGFKMKMKL